MNSALLWGFRKGKELEEVLSLHEREIELDFEEGASSRKPEGAGLTVSLC